MPDFATQLHMSRTRQRIKPGQQVTESGYHYEEFGSFAERAKRIEVVRKLKIDDGLQKFTSQRDGKMYWVLALLKRAAKCSQSYDSHELGRGSGSQWVER